MDRPRPGGVGETEEGELSAQPGMGPRTMRKHLHADVRLCSEALQVFKLFAHDVGASDDTQQYRFFQDDPESEGTGRMVRPVLAPHPYLHTGRNVFRREPRDRFRDDRGRIGGGLQQPRDHHGFVGADRGGFHLHPDVGRAGHLPVGDPPARPPRLPRHPHQPVDDLLVLDSVQTAQIPYVARADRPAPGLHEADLWLGHHQSARNLRSRKAADQPQPSKLRTEPDPPDGRVPVRRHWRSTSSSHRLPAARSPAAEPRRIHSPDNDAQRAPPCGVTARRSACGASRGSARSPVWQPRAGVASAGTVMSIIGRAGVCEGRLGRGRCRFRRPAAVLAVSGRHTGPDSPGAVGSAAPAAQREMIEGPERSKTPGR